MDLQKFDEIVNRVSEVLAQSQALKAENAALQAKAAEAEAAGQDRLVQLQNEVAEWSARCEEQRCEADGLRARVAELETTAAEADGLRARVAELEARIGEVEGQLRAREEELLNAQVAAESDENRLNETASRLENALNDAPRAPAENRQNDGWNGDQSNGWNEGQQNGDQNNGWNGDQQNNGGDGAGPETMTFNFQ